jgi:chemotaxis protein CheZ
MSAEPATIVAEDPRLAHALALVDALRAGNETAIAESMEALAQIRQTDLFRELGRLTRALHDALSVFRSDSRLYALANEDFPDARDRLRHVIHMTEQAATQTLEAIERSKPLCDTVAQQAGVLAGHWRQFCDRRMEVNEFREFSRHLGEFLDTTARNCTTVSHHLSDMLMAQAYQDLTGQIIRRVITLVEEVEQSLVKMVCLSGGVDPSVGVKGGPASRLATEGPQIPGRMSPDAVSSQDEVDTLLSNLGF